MSINDYCMPPTLPILRQVYSESNHTRRATLPQNRQDHCKIDEIVTEMAIPQVLWTQPDVAMRDFLLHIYGECGEVVQSCAKGDL